MKSNFKLFIFCFFAFAFFPSSELLAHHPEQSYIYLRIYKSSIGGRFEYSGRDLNTALGLNISEELSMEELEPHLPRIKEYILNNAAFKSSLGNYEIKFTETTILDLKEELDFTRINFDLVGVDEIPPALDLEYTALFDKDPDHKGMLIVEYNWKAGIHENEAIFTNIYSKGDTQQSLSLTDSSIWKGFVALIKLGVWHIWIGLDHILFIVALILPAVVRRKEPEVQLVSNKPAPWIPVEKFKPAFFYILKIITFFTIAHSITLALASLNIINLPSRIVESIIAFSIALAAFHNIRPIFKSKEWLIAFVFGLFHGFGFASVLGDKGLGGDFMVYSLLGFNIGVEIGQVLIICMIFPILYLIRKQKIYPYIINYGSALLIIIAIYWCIERGFDIDLPAGAYFWKIYNSIFG